LSAAGSSVGMISTGTTLSTANGYTGQNLTIQLRDPVTGIVTIQPTLTIADDASAEDIAKALSSRNGVTAIAYTEVTLTDFIDNSSDGTTARLSINGVDLADFPADNATVDEIADVLDDMVSLINANTALSDQGLIAKSDGATITIRALTGKDIRIGMTGDNTNDSVKISTRTSDSTLQGGNYATVGGYVDVRLQQGARLSADSNTLFQQAPVAVSAYLGYNATINGAPKKGDQFTIEYNEGGVSDNRNALAMAGLETRGTVGGEVSTYNEAYSQLVEVVGSVASQAELDASAAQSLLTSSENRWQELSGVNLDEEAGKLIQFQAAYNASAQVVSIARQLFDTLLNTFR
jgi:flagellar hook-associated protein 1 FlgK